MVPPVLYDVFIKLFLWEVNGMRMGRNPFQKVSTDCFLRNKFYRKLLYVLCFFEGFTLLHPVSSKRKTQTKQWKL